MEQAPILSNNNLVLLINNIQKSQLSLMDWQSEKLNFIPLRSSWFANSETDFDLEAEIDKFMSPQNNKNVMLLMGDSGAGKSLYTQGLVNKLWQNFSAQSPIPIWISLPSLKDPVNKAIEETLSKYSFNNEQIEELRKTRSFIFILDAYDEIRCEKNLYQTNNLDKWNAKIIITCRRECLYHKDNYKLFFAPFIGDKIQYSQYEEIYIRPFNDNQIQIYIQQYIKTQKPSWENSERYQKAIEEIFGLRELIKTPFILKLTMEVLPQIIEKYATASLMERKKVTQAALYDVFIEQWFLRQEKKLKGAKQIEENEDIKPEFWVYAKELATEMHKANLTQVVYNANEESDLFSTEVKENAWAKFFTPTNPKIELLRTVCLVKEISQYHYAFVHSSLLEYFLTRNLYENITIQSTGLITSVAQPIQKIIHSQENIKFSAVVSPSSNSLNNQVNTSIKDDYFNQRLIVKEDNALQFLADRVDEQELFKKSLFDRIYSSRNNQLNKTAAANAITILNRARVVFSGLDLSHIQIPDADLSEALMHYTNLSHSDLQRVTFRDTYLCNANLSNTLMNDVALGQLPMLTFKYAVSSICYSNDGRYLVVISNSKVIIWDLNTMQKSDPIFGYDKDGDSITCVTFSPDGKTIAVAGTTSEWSGYSYQTLPSITIWEITTQQQVGKTIQKTLQGNRISVVNSLAFSPDGKLLAHGSQEKERGIQI